MHQRQPDGAGSSPEREGRRQRLGCTRLGGSHGAGWLAGSRADSPAARLPCPRCLHHSPRPARRRRPWRPKAARGGWLWGEGWRMGGWDVVASLQPRSPSSLPTHSSVVHAWPMKPSSGACPSCTPPSPGPARRRQLDVQLCPSLSRPCQLPAAAHSLRLTSTTVPLASTISRLSSWSAPSPTQGEMPPCPPPSTNPMMPTLQEGGGGRRVWARVGTCGLARLQDAGSRGGGLDACSGWAVAPW